MAGARAWLLSILAAALICALADVLIPKGAVKQTGRLVCGLVLVVAVLGPMARLELEDGRRWLEDYFAAVDGREEELRSQVDAGMKTIIEQRCAAYIVDKAAQLGLECSVRVECETGEEGVYLPVRARVTGRLSEADRAELARLLTQELAIPPEGQSFAEKEGAP